MDRSSSIKRILKFFQVSYRNEPPRYFSAFKWQNWIQVHIILDCLCNSNGREKQTHSQLIEETMSSKRYVFNYGVLLRGMPNLEFEKFHRTLDWFFKSYARLSAARIVMHTIRQQCHFIVLFKKRMREKAAKVHFLFASFTEIQIACH